MKRGFTIFLATLIASLALAVGLAIYDITVRETILSGTQIQSQNAIYAADTGTECALFWDTKYPGNTSSTAFATSSDSITYQTTAPTNQVFCNGEDVVGQNPVQTSWTITQSPPPDLNDATTTFTISMTQRIADACAKVVVEKYGPPPQHTRVTAHGYNTCVANNPNTVERVLQVNY